MRHKKEHIICAAIWFDDRVKRTQQPENIETGFVACGYRHHNVLATISAINQGNMASFLQLEKAQGFLTNYNRFVDRAEAAKIAYDAGQINKLVSKLCSDDIY